MKKTDNLFTTAIILAAGNGERFGGSVRKQMTLLAGKSILHRSVEAFYDCDDITAIVVVIRPEDAETVKNDLLFASKKIHAIVHGGDDRASSAQKGFLVIPNETKYVAIHDAARCMIDADSISNVVKKAYETGAASAVASVTDTVKKLESGKITSTVPREDLVLAQTPQVFSKKLYESALSENCDGYYTDDNMLVEKIGVSITPVFLNCPNIKITTKSDLDLAQFLLSKKEATPPAEYRIGHGYDVHRLVVERKLILGGVDIPFEKGLLGHSDADVLLHAIMDSLLGAVGSRDIGQHFPDSSEEYLGVSSLVLLKKTSEIVIAKGYEIVNVDATVILQLPKLAGYIDEMKINIANTLGISTEQINIKATTEEGLGFTGRGEGIKAESVSLVIKK